jgi:hypothetical protein
MSEQDKIIEAAARFAKQQMEQGGMPQQSQTVAPQPCPMSVQIGQAHGPDGKNLVLFIVHHLTGQSVYHFGAEEAEHIGEAIKQAARQAKTGLEIPRLS